MAFLATGCYIGNWPFLFSFYKDKCPLLRFDSESCYIERPNFICMRLKEEIFSTYADFEMVITKLVGNGLKIL